MLKQKAAGTRNVGVVGRVNGMNEPDPDGSYLRLVLTKDEEREERLISFSAADVLISELTAALAMVRASEGVYS